jgi:methylated-DNA-[protein]-cysteine S-methyltransferase
MDPMNERPTPDGTALEAALSGTAAAPPDPELDRLLAERAAEEGLLDVAYATVDSPLGELVVASTPRGLVRVAYTGFADDSAVLEQLAHKVSPRVLEAPARLDGVRRQLDEYFEGERTDFDLPIDWALTAGFTTRVLQATARIGFGRTGTYAGVATEAGSPRAVRAAGNALGANPMPVVVPCHRVLRSGGALGGYTGGVERKEFLLRLEGVLA